MTTDPHTPGTAAAASGDAEACHGLWLPAGQYQQLLDALAVAADRTRDDLGCAEATCPDPGHREPHAKVHQWRALAGHLAAAPTVGEPVAVVYHADAARRWLAEWAADEFGIDEWFATEELTIAAGLEDLLLALDCNAEPQVWATRPPLGQVQLSRTADGDGVDGGAVITADLRVNGERVRLATGRQDFDDFTVDSATSGVDAAVEALEHVADLVNREVARLLRATATRPPAGFTVVGVWLDDEPVPVGVIAGEHDVRDGDLTVFEQGLWAASVTAPDSATAQQLAVDQMRHGST